ncbi:hypothetical protein PV325_012601 [Microctonus aethiopoides]|nr:hypothetical protein PV325_012601 [Microctonus aethiopoides]
MLANYVSEKSSDLAAAQDYKNKETETFITIISQLGNIITNLKLIGKHFREQQNRDSNNPDGSLAIPSGEGGGVCSVKIPVSDSRGETATYPRFAGTIDRWPLLLAQTPEGCWLLQGAFIQRPTEQPTLTVILELQRRRRRRQR